MKDLNNLLTVVNMLSEIRPKTDQASEYSQMRSFISMTICTTVCPEKSKFDFGT